MCKSPGVRVNMVVHGNGRYYIKSVVTVSCSGHDYGFMEGGLQNRQWHTAIKRPCEGKQQKLISKPLRNCFAWERLNKELINITKYT